MWNPFTRKDRSITIPMIPADHKHIVQVVNTRYTIVLPMKVAAEEAKIETKMYVEGWNDAMIRATNLVAELRLGPHEFQHERYS